MSDFPRCKLAGLTVRAAKLLSPDKPVGWESVIKASDIERFLAEHHCVPVGDTAEKVVADLLAHHASTLPQDILARIEDLTRLK